MIVLGLKRKMIEFEILAEIEGLAIKNRFDPHTMDFGVRKHKSSTISPAMLLHVLSRKKCRHRNSRQVDLIKQKFIVLGQDIKSRKYNVMRVQL